LNINNLKLIAKQKLIDALSINKDVELEFCESCALGKQHWELFPKEGGLKVAKILGLGDCDI
jgi:hypothetical protein